MPAFEPATPDYEARVRASFERQAVMKLIDARLTRVTPGMVEIELPLRPELTQQHGFLHAGIITTIVDSACGYAAYSLMPLDAAVLTVEFKVNFVSPASGGDLAIARGQVLKPGRTMTICRGDVFMCTVGDEKLVATMLATMMVVRDRDGLVG